MEILRRLATGIALALPRRRLARTLARSGERARDAGRTADAALLFTEALKLHPRAGAVQLQAGNMRKDLGEYDTAQGHYETALRLRPHDPDVAIQLGHLAKAAGRADEAIRRYGEALRRSPGHEDAAFEIAELERRRGGSGPGAAENDAASPAAILAAGLVPELLPRTEPPVARPRERLLLARAAGRIERTPWGSLPSLRGVEAIRGVCLSAARFDRVVVRLDDEILWTETIEPRIDEAGFTHIFNIWIDVSALESGRRVLHVALMAGDSQGPSARETVAVLAPLPDDEGIDLDVVVRVPPGDPATLEARIRALPSVVRPARRERRDIRSILLMRPDQLGDLIVSIPAIRRLRSALPDARLIGMLSEANVGLARSLGLFDDIVVAAFMVDRPAARGSMAIADQQALRRKLAAFDLDVAIDFGVSHMSRTLLLLTGARELRGFDRDAWPWLDARLDGSEPDRKSHLESVPHSEKLVWLIDQFIASAVRERPILPREDDGADRLRELGLAPGGYIVLHESDRHIYNLWPGFVELTRELLATTPLDIAFVTDIPGRQETLLAMLPSPERMRLLEHRLPFADLDALLAGAAAFAGVDSGPKHLAALRGTPVVSIHASRTSWREWGQEHGGVIVSRRVPCAGCGIAFEDTCGKGLSCIADIRPAEIAAAVRALIGPVVR